MERVCQSCGIPLSQEIQGTEKKARRSTEYCKFCYRNGQFINKNMTYKEMKRMGRRGIYQSKNFFLLKWLMVLVYPLQLKKLKRWRNQK
ncbi:MAG: zinc ribbon domain-containing protein [Turicibacter sp.]